MRISDWSSDVCSSDLKDSAIAGAVLDSDKHGRVRIVESDTNIAFALLGEDIEKITRVEDDDQIFAGVVDFDFFGRRTEFWAGEDRKSVSKGKSVSVRVDLGGRSSTNKNIKRQKD